MSTPTKSPSTSSAPPTPSQLAARARLAEVRSEVAGLHEEMAQLKDELQQMTQTYMEDMQAMVLQTVQQAIQGSGAVQPVDSQSSGSNSSRDSSITESIHSAIAQPSFTCFQKDWLACVKIEPRHYDEMTGDAQKDQQPVVRVLLKTVSYGQVSQRQYDLAKDLFEPSAQGLEVIIQCETNHAPLDIMELPPGYNAQLQKKNP